MILGVIPPGEHQVLVFLVQVAVLIALARLLGAAARRVGQPAVVGELIAGIVAGPSLFGRLSSGGFDWVFPDVDGEATMLFALAWLGLLLLLADTGIESDLAVVRSLGRPVALVAIGSLIVPLAGGYVLGLFMPGVLMGDRTSPGAYAAFIAVAMSISSLPVVARVLTELGMVRRNVGQLILATAVTNDVVGWLLLGLVVGVAGSGSEVSVGSLATTLAAVAAFGMVTLTVGARAVDRLLRALAGRGVEAHVAAVIGTVAIASAVTQAIGVEVVLGAFAAGVVIGRSRWRDDRAITAMATMTNAVLAPLFFATAGLRLDLGVFTDATVAVWSVVIVAVASVTKLVGAGLGARLAGLPGTEARALGVGLNARGALEIVIASIGLEVGILTDASYAAIVVMALATSIAAPPLLRRTLRGWSGTADEQERLAAEGVAMQRIIVSDRPPVLLSRGRPPSIVAAQMLQACWPAHHPVEIATSAQKDQLIPILNTFADRRTRITQVRESADLPAMARKGYSAVVVGVDERPGQPMLGDLHQRMLAETAVPVVLVRRERISGKPLPPAFAHALIPITDSLTSRAALELGTGMAIGLGTRLTLVNVVAQQPVIDGFVATDLTLTPELVLREAADAARAGGTANVATVARSADHPAAEISRIGIELDVDVVVVGSTIASGRLGPAADHLLHHSPATVVVVATPPGWTGPHHNR